MNMNIMKYSYIRQIVSKDVIVKFIFYNFKQLTSYNRFTLFFFCAFQPLSFNKPDKLVTF